MKHEQKLLGDIYVWRNSHLIIEVRILAKSLCKKWYVEVLKSNCAEGWEVGRRRISPMKDNPGTWSLKK